MKIQNILKKLSLLCLVVTISFAIVGCKKDKRPGDGGKETYYDNETDPLVFSTLAVDKVFNPFFSTSATDSNVVGLTQISMLGNDAAGKPTYGDNEAVVTKDLQIITEGTEDVDQTTTYYFVLKNNVQFSNGTYLTMKDVLFNLYVYLDRAYMGSSTIYSTDIVGLKEYRTQASTETEQDNFELQFQVKAEDRINALVEASLEIFDDHKNESLDQKLYLEYLKEYINVADVYKNVVKDYEKACELFEEELNTDYSNALNSYEDMVFSNESGKVFRNLFTTDVEVFLYNEGYISWNRKEGKLESSLTNNPESLKNWTKEQAIETIIEDKIPNAIDEIVQYWNTSNTLFTYIVQEEIEEYSANNTNRKYKNISGITFANREEAVTVNNVKYNAPVYNPDGSVKEGNEVLSIKINNVDPKAIWNFAFAVAPLYYYSDKEHIDAFDYVENFGVEYNSQTFMNKVIKAKNDVPVGAGAYAASKSNGGITNISSSDFYDLGVIYYERNPYFVLGPAKIKKVRLQVVSSNQMLNSLYAGEVDFVEPNAKPETITELDGKKSEGIENKPIQTAGYGYIGVNAGKVPDLAVRQAIMHSINTKECVDYYKTTAEAIYRPMSKSSWAYPENATPYYPYIGGPVPENLAVVNPAYRNYVIKLSKKTGDKFTEAEQLAFIKELVEGAGYKMSGSGVYAKGSHKLVYKFTVAGEETDHPAWQALFHSSEILNKVGFQITVGNDPTALTKLATGDLTVWAAAWGSTIDPDMYQVYHKDSKATSVLNWGYNQINNNIGGQYDEEKEIVSNLSNIIDLARKTNDEDVRGRLYSQALDLVMQLAIELPTYQRDDLFAYNANKIDVSTLTQVVSPYKGLTSDLHSVSLYEEK